MPTPKKFNTLSDIEKQLGDSTRALYNQAAQQSQTAQQNMVAQQPTVNVQYVPSEPAPVAPPVRRRKAPQCIIPRENGKLLFLEERHNKAIEDIHWTSKVDRQDVIRTAVDDFINRYFNGERLNEEGERLIRAYFQKTHV